MRSEAVQSWTGAIAALALLAVAQGARADEPVPTPPIGEVVAAGRLAGGTYTNGPLGLRVSLGDGWGRCPDDDGQLVTLSRRGANGMFGVGVEPRRKELSLRRQALHFPAAFLDYKATPVEKSDLTVAGRPAVKARQTLERSAKAGQVREVFERVFVAQGDWLVIFLWRGPDAPAPWDTLLAGVELGGGESPEAGAPPPVATLEGELDRLTAAGAVERRVWRQAELGLSLPLPPGFKPAPKPAAPPHTRVLLAGVSPTSAFEVRLLFCHLHPYQLAAPTAQSFGGRAESHQVGGHPAATLVCATSSTNQMRSRLVSVGGWTVWITWVGPRDDPAGPALLDALTVGAR